MQVKAGLRPWENSGKRNPTIDAKPNTDLLHPGLDQLGNGILR